MLSDLGGTIGTIRVYDESKLTEALDFGERYEGNFEDGRVYLEHNLR